MVGTAPQSGSLSAALGIVSFGSVAVGATANSALSLTNKGSAPVRVVQVSVTGQDFSVNGVGDLPIAIGAGATYNLNLSFFPKGTGPAVGQLTIVSDDATNGTIEIGLSGTGVETYPPVALTGFNCSNTSLTGPATDNCTVTLSSAAAAGGFTVSLVSSNGALEMPASVTVPAGATSANFKVIATAVSAVQTVTLTASAGGIVETFVLQLNPTRGGGTSAPTLSGLTCASSALTGSGSDSCTVTLSSAAPSGGFVANLASNNTAVVVPTSVTVPAGATSTSFIAAVSSVSSVQAVTLTASAEGVVEAFTLQLNASGSTLAVNGTILAFGNVNLNSPSTQTLTLTASGVLPLTITAAVIVGPGFSVESSALPLTLNAGNSATLNVQFNPTVAGPATGTLTIVSTSLTNPLMVINLNGTGVSTSYEVDLTWDAPSGSDDPVVGYIVFRSTSGVSLFTPLNVAVLTGTNYADTTVQNGQTYDYFVESVDALGGESVPSNTATAAIP